MKKLLAAILALLAGAGIAGAEPRTFAVGDAVEMYYAGNWYPGIVVVVAPGDRQGTYLVRDASGEHDYDWQRLRLEGQDLRAPGDMTAESTFGLWGVGAAGGPDAWSAHQGALMLNADGSFEWHLDPKAPLKGNWELNPAPGGEYGPVKIVGGLFGHTWWATYAGKSDQGQHILHLRSDNNTSVSGFRW